MHAGLFVSLECTLSMAAPMGWAAYELLTLKRSPPPKPPRWSIPLTPIAPTPEPARVLEELEAR